MYVRDDADEVREIDRWDRGVGWMAFPSEGGRRASHALVGDDGGVWVFDPLDAPGVDELLGEQGEVAGVVVLSDYHARDADTLAARHGVPVYVPEWLSRVVPRVDAPTERVADELAGSGFRLRSCRPLPGWREAIAYRESDGTLYVPDVLGTASQFRVGDERLGVYLLVRPFPPARAFAGVAPDRILVGHGEGVFDDADRALADALDGARRRFPRALVENGATQMRALLEAIRE